jgi:hypothetical protein
MLREAQWRVDERIDPKTKKAYYSSNLAQKEAEEYVEKLQEEYDVKEIIREPKRIRIIYDDKQL